VYWRKEAALWGGFFFLSETRKAVERPLQNKGSGMLVYDSCAPFPADVGGDQFALHGSSRQSLIP
jgi:hypothetical protein